MGSRNKGVDYPKHTLWYRFTLWVLGYCLIIAICIKRFNIRTERYEGKIERPYVLTYNHICDYDFLGVLNSMRYYGRFIISDALLRKRSLRWLLKIGTNGIYRRKGESADDAIEAAKATVAKGINVNMAAEGEECPNGVTAEIRKRTGQMIKDLDVDLITFRMDGGYFLKPKWADHRSGGPLTGKVINIYKKEDLEKMTVEQINDIIYRDLYVNHYEWNREHKVVYDRECRAEHMERLVFRCPKCMKDGHLHSHVDVLSCDSCGYSVSVDEYGFFDKDAIFDNLYDWDMWQRSELVKESQTWEDDPDLVIASDEHCILKVMSGDNAVVLDDDVTISMTHDEITIKGGSMDMRFPLKDRINIVAVRGGCGITYDGKYYRIEPKTPSCMRRYRTILRIIRKEKYLG
ncbi:MAG: lysophospholipid acyltransferase family protein [Methanomassiliicoccales archaeon]|nr:lysophospholipid acyltransferase family protein [Methanomassiliicoccales archaeon]